MVWTKSSNGTRTLLPTKKPRPFALAFEVLGSISPTFGIQLGVSEGLVVTSLEPVFELLLAFW